MFKTFLQVMHYIELGLGISVCSFMTYHVCKPSGKQEKSLKLAGWTSIFWATSSVFGAPPFLLQQLAYLNASTMIAALQDLSGHQLDDRPLLFMCLGAVVDVLFVGYGYLTWLMYAYTWFQFFDHIPAHVGCEFFAALMFSFVDETIALAFLLYGMEQW